MNAKILVPGVIAEMAKMFAYGKTWTLAPRWNDEDEGDNTLMSLLNKRYPSTTHRIAQSMNKSEQDTYEVYKLEGQQEERLIVTITLIKEGPHLYFHVYGTEGVISAESVIDDILDILEEIYDKYGVDEDDIPGWDHVELY